MPSKRCFGTSVRRCLLSSRAAMLGRPCRATRTRLSSAKINCCSCGWPGSRNCRGRRHRARSLSLWTGAVWWECGSNDHVSLGAHSPPDSPRATPKFLMCNARPGFSGPWPAESPALKPWVAPARGPAAAAAEAEAVQPAAGGAAAARVAAADAEDAGEAPVTAPDAGVAVLEGSHRGRLSPPQARRSSRRCS